MKGVAKILKGDGPEHAGMGIVLDRHRILTCAHVINTALGLGQKAADHPAEEVSVTFPLTPGVQRMRGKVTVWHPVDASEISDAAVITLDQELPPAVEIPVFANDRTLGRRDEVAVYGIAAGSLNGDIINGRYVGEVDGNVGQIDGLDFVGAFIASGFSGGGVFKNDEVVGMVISRKEGESRIAHMHTIANLRKIVPLVRETRPERASRIQLRATTVKPTKRSDVVSSYCKHCAEQVRLSFPDHRFNSSAYAWSYSGSSERYFYIAEVAGALNRLAKSEEDAFPLSYELYFPEPESGGHYPVEVSLVWDNDYDEEIFGTYRAQERMHFYLDEVRERLNKSFSVDFVRLGADGVLELGFRRQLAVNSQWLVQDTADGEGASSTVEDLINLRKTCEPILTSVIMEYRRP